MWEEFASPGGEVRPGEPHSSWRIISLLGAGEWHFPGEESRRSGGAWLGSDSYASCTFWDPEKWI